ncbi:MAG: SDR family NAD(P)-dependent oxidoreductase [Bacteroidales bacterium]|nr:SDR family NAD(P)-dependent oxidoreductase [Bacteroidales bacterium]
MKNIKIILITGASSGIGYDAAETLAKQGHRVYAAARRVECMEPLKEFGVNILKMDVTDEASMKQGVEAVFQAEGRIDVLVNNAGYGYFGAIENVSIEEARRQVEVNVFGLARLTQLVLPIMRAQGSGRIINTSSIAGKMVIYLGGWYNVTKYAVEAFSDALRMEVKPFGIDVVKIEPGAIKTDWGIIAAKNLKESSEGTAYEETGARWSNSMRWFYKSNLLSSPKVITRLISRAVNSRYPRAVYCRGRFSFSGRVAHALLPARWWDAIMRKLGKIKVKQQ